MPRRLCNLGEPCDDVKFLLRWRLLFSLAAPAHRDLAYECIAVLLSCLGPCTASCRVSRPPFEVRAFQFTRLLPAGSPVQVLIGLPMNLWTPGLGVLALPEKVKDFHHPGQLGSVSASRASSCVHTRSCPRLRFRGLLPGSRFLAAPSEGSSPGGPKGGVEPHGRRSSARRRLSSWTNSALRSMTRSRRSREAVH